ncbi:thermonuclease family protein [Streptosporangium sp. NPDC000563]|uniref:thermonuclease family protein n=1 Tax=Streptosporangium sp. NPDC000563 TaxID=3154366 RepID=UPI0033180FF0
MGIGVGFGLGPVRVSSGVSSRSLAQGCLPLFVLAIIVWIVKAVLTALYVFFSWPSRLVEPLARQVGLDQVHQAGVQWAAVALLIEFFIVIIGLLVSASGTRNLFLGTPGTKPLARFWRFWAVALFPVVTAATVGMAQAPEPVDSKIETSSAIASTDPSPTPAGEFRPSSVPVSAQRAIVMNVSSGDTLRVKAITSGPVIPSTNQTVVRLLGIAAPRSSECKANWATRFLASYLPRSSHVWIARGAGSQTTSAPLAVYLWRDGGDRTMLNARLLVSGSARVVTAEVRGKIREMFTEYESKARAAHRGIHSCVE